MKNKTRMCPACGEEKSFRQDQKTCGCGGTNPLKKVGRRPSTEDMLQKTRDKKEGKDRTITELTERVVQLEKEKDALFDLSELTPQLIDVPPKASSGNSESAAVFVWSDHHTEEEVRPEAVGHKNAYNLDIGDRRFISLLHGSMSWLKISMKNTTIKTIVMALLGDFISGSIHEDLAESNLLPPVEAIYRAQNQLITGVKFVLDSTPKDMEIVVVCHSGNHGRMTKKQRISTEAGNSLEHYMYYTMQDYFQDEPRVKFLIAEGYHSFVRFFEGRYEGRFHHGHQINYQGGVGGITIPVNKAISQWNKAHPVNLDVFGHFHTRFDGGNFIANGSLIGYNAYAVSIKASFEKPSQTVFLVNREYQEKTAVMPVFVEDPQ